MQLAAGQTVSVAFLAKRTPLVKEKRSKSCTPTLTSRDFLLPWIARSLQLKFVSSHWSATDSACASSRVTALPQPMRLGRMSMVLDSTSCGTTATRIVLPCH